MNRASTVKAAVRDRDGLACVDCGCTDKEHRERTSRGLEVHRIVPGSEYTVDGCVTVCRICHGLRHRGDDSPVAIHRRSPKPKANRKGRPIMCYLSESLVDALHKFQSSLEVRTSLTSIANSAVREFLTREGFMSQK